VTECDATIASMVDGDGQDRALLPEKHLTGSRHVAPEILESELDAFVTQRAEKVNEAMILGVKGPEGVTIFRRNSTLSA
jgi:hypothetical protein